VEALASTIDTYCLAKLQRLGCSLHSFYFTLLKIKVKIGGSEGSFSRQRASSKHLLLSYPNEKQQAPQQKRSEPLSEKAILAEQSLGSGRSAPLNYTL
jgi:hypothetical protein